MHILRKEDNMKKEKFKPSTNEKNVKKERKHENHTCNKIHNCDKVIVIVSICIIIALISIIAYLVYKGNNPKLSDGKQVVASLNGKDFTAEELYAELNTQGGYNVLIEMIDEYIINKEITDKKEAEKYADSVIAQYELSYKDSGTSFEDAVVQAGYVSVKAFKELVMNDYLYNEVAENYIKEHITEEDLKDYYDNHVSDELGVKHILISPEVESGATSEEKKKAEEKAKKEAENLIKKLKDGEDFEKLAKEHSDDEGTAKNGGVINNVVKDKYVTEFWDAAYKLELNKYTTKPVKTTYGYHIIYKVSHTKKKAFDEIKDTLYDSVLTEKTTEDTKLIDKSWVELRKEYKLEIVDTTIERKYDSVIKDLTK